MNRSLNKAGRGLTAIGLIALGAAMTAVAADPPASPSKLVLRSLSPQDIKDYALTGQQGASGLSTVGVGQPAYFEVLVPASMAASNIVGISWSLTAKPFGSAADLADSPLGANVPAEEPVDRIAYKVGARKLLRPDLEGRYTVVATLTLATSTTNFTQNITAARYLGWSQGCAACHSGGLLAQDMTSWTNTRHATMLTRNIDDVTGHYGANCISCHTVGYDANTNAVNGGFDDVAKELGWKFPSVLAPTNWASMPAALKNLSNIQCENCHGPGSQHVFSDGKVGNTAAIGISLESGNCGQCHDSKSKHYRNAEWANSMHAVATRDPSGPGRGGCVGCHTAKGFIGRMDGLTTLPTEYGAIGCSTCHDPHADENPHQLRAGGPIKLMDGFTTITNAGNSALCMTCHLSRRNATNYVEVTTGGSTFGPHHSNQADMLAGANAVTYGKVIPSSAHGSAIKEGCVHCHMQDVMSTQPGFTQVGGHTFKLAVETATNHVELVGACVECHGDIKSFDFPTQDYDGNGVVEGVQTEVKSLLRKLATMLPPVGVPKDTIAINNTWTRQQLRAGYNWRFVAEEGSYGVHNVAYAVGLIKASIADLTGDGNSDGLPDAWQIQYFGSATSPDAAPDADPANDNIPNWLKWSLGLDPRVAGIKLPDGVVWANQASVVGTTNTIKVFTAAEIVFDTEQGKTYQLQAIKTLGGGWSNVGEPIPGTGTAVSYVTPTRVNGQQYYRVVTNP